MYGNKRLSAAKKIQAPGWFMLVAVLALLWNLAGLVAFFNDMFVSEARLANMSDARRALHLGMPGWVWAAYGLAVIAGTLGALMLVLKRSVAVPLLMLSLGGVLLQMFHAYMMTRTAGEAGGASWLTPVVIIAISIALLGLAMKGRNHGWLP